MVDWWGVEVMGVLQSMTPPMRKLTGCCGQPDYHQSRESMNETGSGESSVV